MNWLQYFSQLSPTISTQPAADERQIIACESSLKISLPEALRELLSQTNGVLGEYELGLTWPVHQIEQTNLQYRQSSDWNELYMPFDSLLFFGDAGNGDQFAFPIHSGAIRRPDVFAWSHESDSRTWVAPSLEKYFEWWLTGKILL